MKLRKGRRLLSWLLVCTLIVTQVATASVFAEDGTTTEPTTATKASTDADAVAKEKAEAKAKAETAAKEKAEAEVKAQAAAETKAKAASEEKAKEETKATQEKVSNDANKEKNDTKSEDESSSKVETTSYTLTFNLQGDKEGGKVFNSDKIFDDGSKLVADNAKVKFEVSKEKDYDATVTLNGKTVEPVSDDKYELTLTKDETIYITFEKIEKNIDEEMPAQELTATASDGAVITVKAQEGTFTANAKVKVSTVAAKTVAGAIEEQLSENKKLEDVAAYDIAIIDKDGNEIQPEKNVTVTITGSNIKGNAIEVYHVDGSSAEKLAAGQSTDKAAFSAEHFSIYAVAGLAVTETQAKAAPSTGKTVTFNKNGGNKAAPNSISGSVGSVVTLPAYSGTNGSKTFVGWSTDKDATNAGSAHFTKPVYSAGSEYTIESNVTLYAVWANSNLYADFYIRTDGTIPDEPASYKSSEYTKQAIHISGAIKVGQFIADPTGVKVAANLAKQPSTAQIKAVLPSYDPDNQYVIWYVMKHEGGHANDAWNVDGVVLTKAKVNLYYRANTPNQTVVEGTFPLGSQYAKGATVTTDSGRGFSLTGYTFTGWNTEADGSGTAYTASDKFVINADTTLYAQWKPNTSTKYTIEYYLQDGNGNYPTSATQSNTKYAQTGAVVNAGAKTFTGYVYDENYKDNKQTGTVSGDGSLVLKRYYKKDSSQTKDLSYSVEYYKDGTLQSKDTQTETDTVWVNAADTLNVDGSKINVTNKYVGYKFEKTDPTEIPTTIANKGVIKVYYVKDDSQKAEVKYTVEHWIKGADKAFATSDTTAKVWINGEKELAVTEASLAKQAPVGYKYESITPEGTKAGTIVKTGSTIKLIYVKDSSQTKDLSYTVEYYKDGTLQSKDTQTETDTVWVNAADTLNVDDSKINVINKYVGYKFEKTDPKEIPTTIANKGVIKVYYVKDDSQKAEVKYTVEHWIKGADKAFATADTTAKVWVNGEKELAVTEASLAKQAPVGYKYESIMPEGMKAGTIVADGSTIKLIYVKDDSQKAEVKYTVEHWIKGADKAFATADTTAKVWVNGEKELVVTEASLAKQAPAGYKYESITPEGTKAGTIVKTGSTIKLIYVKDSSQTKDLSYTVEYYKDGTLQSKDTQTEKDTVWVNAADTLNVDDSKINVINKYVGYKFEKTDPKEIPTTIANKGVIKVYYVKDDSQKAEVKYTVEHWIKGADKAFATADTTAKVWVNGEKELAVTADSLTQKAPTGYKYESITPEGMKAGTIVAEGSTIKLIYVKDNSQKTEVKYTVEHWIKGADKAFATADTTAKVWINGEKELAVTADSLTQKAPTGYKYESITPEGMKAGTIVADGSTIKLIYVKDDSQKASVKYTVEHWIKGADKAFATADTTAKVWVNGEKELTVTGASLAKQAPVGYKYESITPEGMKAGTIVADGSTIKLIYVKDDSQKAEVKYTVEHWIKGADKAFATADTTAKVWINGEKELTVTEASLAKQAPVGYKYESITPEGTKAGTIVKTGSTIKLIYVKDDSQTKDLSYSVEYYKDGTLQSKDTQTETDTVWVNAADTLNVDGSKINVTNKYVGYKFEKTDPKEIPTTIANKGVIKVYYVKDDSQKTEVKYTVEHWIKGADKAFATADTTAKVWINGEKELAVTADSLTQKAPTGYKYESITPEGMKAGTIVADGSTIKLIYVKDDSQKAEVKYTVEHWIKGADKAFATADTTAKVWINGEKELTVTEASLAKQAPVGYKYESITPEGTKAGTIVKTGSTIKLIYVKDSSQTKDLSYTVEYYKNGTLQSKDTQTETDTVWVNAADTLNVDGSKINVINKYVGYKFEKTDPKEIPTTIANKGVIKVYYVKDESQKAEVKYTVEHWIKGADKAFATADTTAKVWVNGEKELEVTADSLTQKAPTGYKYESITPEGTKAGTIVKTGSTIKLIYVKDSSQTKDLGYTVEYYKDGTLQSKDTQTETDTVWVNAADTLNVDGSKINVTNKYVGYKFEKTDPTEIPTTIANKGVIKVYYVKDDSQKAEVKYTVEHWIKGADRAFATADTTAKVWINGEKELAVTADSLTQKAPIGYKYESITPEGTKAGTIVKTESTIKLIYVKDDSQTKDLSYTVEYYKDGTLQSGDTQNETKAVWINDNVVPVDMSKINTTDKYKGYNFVNTNPEPIPSAVEGDAVIKVYYAAATNTKYTVQYYYEENGAYPEDPTFTVTREGTTDATATATDEDKVPAEGKENYGFDEYNPNNLLEAIINGEGTTVLKLYFAEDQYYYEGSVRVTKAVYKDNEENNSNETYYAGIFEDQACTKMVTNADSEAVIIPISMDGGFLADNEMGVPMTEAGQKWYVTEVTKDGTPVEGTDNFKFSVNGSENAVVGITVNRDETTEVSLRNDYYSDVEQFYPGDGGGNGDRTTITTSSTTTTTETADSDNTGKSVSTVQTGDDSSMMPFILLAAMAALIAIAVMFRRERKQIAAKNKED